MILNIMQVYICKSYLLWVQIKDILKYFSLTETHTVMCNV